MPYALVIDGALVAVRQPGRLETKLSDGAQLGAPDGIWTDDLAALCGFVPITETDQPPDTATTTHDRTIEIIDGAPTVVWVERPKTAEPRPLPTDALADTIDIRDTSRLRSTT